MWAVSEEGGGRVAVDYVFPVRLLYNGLLTCKVEEIVEEGGVTVVGGKGGYRDG